jgi:succinate dehydrogenase / fumarate reductase iron-sulfur subunit
MWTVRYRVFRYKGEAETRRYEQYSVEVEPDETVLDGLEKIWASQDRTLAFRHACHHASCGSCGIRVNGRERLACVTAIREVTDPGGVIVCDPLRNFPVVSDLVVDFEAFFAGLDAVAFSMLRTSELDQGEAAGEGGNQRRMRFENCIECGLCVSACPIAGQGGTYVGPAALAAAWRMMVEPRGVEMNEILPQVDHEQGCWRCHAAFECSEVCPSNVDPAAAIMAIRSGLIRGKLGPPSGRDGGPVR